MTIRELYEVFPEFRDTEIDIMVQSASSCRTEILSTPNDPSMCHRQLGNDRTGEKPVFRFHVFLQQNTLSRLPQKKGGRS